MVKRLMGLVNPLIPYTYLKAQKKIRCLSPGPERFMDSFFYDTVHRFRHLPGQQIIEVPFDRLPEVEEKLVPVKLLIFHVSRCGSTLLSQMLAQSKKNIVLSEPMIIDELLRSELPLAEKKEAIRKCANLLASPKTGMEMHTIIKLDSWHILYIDILKEIFTAAKVCFLFREPEAIIRSHQKFRGRQMVPTVLDVELVNESVAPHDLDGYAMRILAAFYTNMLEKSAEADVFLDYSGIVSSFSELCRVAGMQFSAAEIDVMLQRVAFHSKTPQQAFYGDEFLTAELDSIYLQKLYQLYARLFRYTVKC